MLRITNQIEVEVFNDQCEIFIRQGSPGGEQDIILISTDQVDLLIKWLFEAKLELIARG